MMKVESTGPHCLSHRDREHLRRRSVRL